jgi:hypothetical protein
MVKERAATPPDSDRYPKEVLESPMLHSTHLLFRMTAQVKVVPEKSVSMVGSTLLD